MAAITDEFMRAMCVRARSYSPVLLKRSVRYADPDAAGVVWGHGRRNHSVRADGVLAILWPVADGEWAGIGIFNASPGETARIMDGDPAVQADVLSHEVHLVRSFPGDSLT